MIAIDDSGADTSRAAIGSSGTVLSSDTDQPVTKRWTEEDRTVAGTSETLNLASLPDGQDWTGLKVQFVHIKTNSANNAAGMTFGKGASNGYEILNHATGSIVLDPGDELLIKFKESLADIASGARNIDIACTAGDKYTINLVAG